MSEFNCVPEPLYARSAPLRQGATASAEVRGGVQAAAPVPAAVPLPVLGCPSPTPTRDVTERAATQATERSTVSRIKPEQVNFGTFFLQIDFILCIA